MKKRNRRNRGSRRNTVRTIKRRTQKVTLLYFIVSLLSFAVGVLVVGG